MESAPHTPPRIAIIGAGLAGLTAAYRLTQKGFSPEIYEARERPGGRAFTYYDGLSFEELGGKLLPEDEDACHLRSLLSEIGLKTQSFAADTRFLHLNGKILDYYQLFLNAPAPTEETYALLTTQSRKAANMLDVLQWFFADYPELLHVFTLFLMNYEGPSADQLGTYFLDMFWKFYCADYEDALKKARGENFLTPFEAIEGGASKLVKALCKKLPPIHYRSVAKKIYRHSQEKLAVEFEEQTELFDKVIMAIPCSTLRDIEIEPDWIPADQIEAIQKLRYGTLGKIVLPVQIQGEEHPSISFGKDFICFFNKDLSFVTLYCSNPTFWSHFDNLYAVEKHIQEQIRSLKELYPTLGITGEPIVINWSSEPYSKGSYSNFGLDLLDFYSRKSTAFGEEVKHVFRPVDSQLFFAGEHTTFKFYATMEGAVESGERIARMLEQSLLSDQSETGRFSANHSEKL
jgi:monoamine oxidase